MRILMTFLLPLLILMASANLSTKGNNAMAQVSYAGKVNAPDFPPGLEWLNTDHPISLKDLRGKIVLLDFWTFCCINCMHVIPDLKKLESKYADELVVIGVHSAKFTTEKGTDNIREAILRYGLEHPVVNDKDFEVWNSYAVNAWPTFMIIDPDGKVVGKHSGEGVYDLFDQVIGGIVKEFDAQGRINRKHITFALEKNKAPESFLKFPGKIAADSSGSRLYVTDSNHNRIVIVSAPEYAVQDVVGSGEPGLKDGDFSVAQFNKPQGIAVDGRVLYVADTENHAIRKVDLDARTVTTLAGDGKQAMRSAAGGPGKSTELNSPWDLLVHNGKLYIAMAGPHQLWTLDLRTLEAAPYAGSGQENIIDGPLPDAALAQPSGITTDGKRLYFADSEVSAVRSASFSKSGRVETIVGKGLFDYGDIDGRDGDVRLQHPIGVVYHNGLLYVADTYNNKVKTVDPATKQTTTLIGTGKTGLVDGKADEAELNEPNGLVFVGDKLYVTDTNNHVIRVYDPRSGRVTTLRLRDAEKLMSPVKRSPAAFKGDSIEVAAQNVSAGDGMIDVTVNVPAGYKLNAMAPFYIGYSSENSEVVRLLPKMTEQNIQDPKFPISIPATFGVGKTNVNVNLIVYYCAEGKESLCLIKQLRVVIPVQVERTDGDKTVSVNVGVEPA